MHLDYRDFYLDDTLRPIFCMFSLFPRQWLFSVILMFGRGYHPTFCERKKNETKIYFIISNSKIKGKLFIEKFLFIVPLVTYKNWLQKLSSIYYFSFRLLQVNAGNFGNEVTTPLYYNLACYNAGRNINRYKKKRVK